MSYVNRHISNDTWIAYDGMSNPEEKEIEVTANFITEDGFEEGYYEIRYFFTSQLLNSHVLCGM